MSWIVPEGGTLTQDLAWPPYDAPLKNVVPYGAWTINGLANAGYPYCELMIDIPKLRIDIVKQNQYICVYDTETPREGFNCNGLAILAPMSCSVKEAENSEYNVSLVHPMDADRKYEFLQEWNYLKILGQIYTIRKLDADYDAKKVTLYAEHISYQLNDAWIFPHDGSKIVGNRPAEVMQDIMTKATYLPAPGHIVYTFECYSDIDTMTPPFSKEVGDGMTPMEAIIGSGGLCAACNGLLRRDNFYLSVNNPMEDSNPNAFNLRVGNNLHGIKRIIDTTTMCTHFTAYDNFGNGIGVSYISPLTRQFPHNIVRSKRFTFDQPDWNALVRECFAYFGACCQPIVSYTFDIADGKGNPTFDDIDELYRYRVGDSGTIYDERIGGSLTLRITETETDGITGRTIRFTVGNRRSFTRPSTAPVQIVGNTTVDSALLWIRDKNGVGLIDRNGKYLYQEMSVNG